MFSKFVLAQYSTSLLGTYMIKDNFSMDTVNILHTLIVIKLFHLRLILMLTSLDVFKPIVKRNMSIYEVKETTPSDSIE